MLRGLWFNGKRLFCQKTRHPHLSSKWQEPDLSKLAWPLMELAKALEGKEGPGDVQVCYFHCKPLCRWIQRNGSSVLTCFCAFHTKLIEVPDAVYQKISTESENNG